MASALTLKAATPFCLKYAYAYDGTGGAGSSTLTRSLAQMITDLEAAKGPNPLADYLAGIAAAGGGLVFAAAPQGEQLSLYATTESLSKPLSVSFNGGTNMLNASATDGTASAGTIEIRYHHTFDR